MGNQQETNMNFNSTQNMSTTESSECNNVNQVSISGVHAMVDYVDCGGNFQLATQHMAPKNSCVMSQGAKSHASSQFKGVVNQTLGGVGAMPMTNQNINANVNMTQNISTNMSATCNNKNVDSIHDSAFSVRHVKAKGDCKMLTQKNSGNNSCQMTQQASSTASTAASITASQKTRDFGDEIGDILSGLLAPLIIVAVIGLIAMVGMHMLKSKKKTGGGGDDDDDEDDMDDLKGLSSQLGGGGGYYHADGLGLAI